MSRIAQCDLRRMDFRRENRTKLAGGVRPVALGENT